MKRVRNDLHKTRNTDLWSIIAVGVSDTASRVNVLEMKNFVIRCFMGSAVTEQDLPPIRPPDPPTLDPWLKSSLLPFHLQNPSQITKWGNAPSDWKSSWLQHTHTLRTISWNMNTFPFCEPFHIFSFPYQSHHSSFQISSYFPFNPSPTNSRPYLLWLLIWSLVILMLCQLRTHSRWHIRREYFESGT
jgi:hypothetical protein